MKQSLNMCYSNKAVIYFKHQPDRGAAVPYGIDIITSSNVLWPASLKLVGQ